MASSVASSLYKTYSAYSDDKIPPRVKKIIKDLEALVPNLLGKERMEFIQKIERIKELARTGRVGNNLMTLILDICKYAVGYVGGPLGNSFAVYTVQNLKEKYLEKKGQILKAEKIGGRRVVRRCKEKKSSKTSAFAQAFFAGALGFTLGLTGIQAFACSVAYYTYDSVVSSLVG